MAEKKFSEERRCEHCSNTAPMAVATEYSQVKGYDDQRHNMSWDEGYVFQLLECPACQKVVCRKYYWHEMQFDPDEGFTFEVLYPIDRKLPQGLPPHILKSYEAAMKVKGIDANSFAVLIGRLMEQICEDRNAVGDTLHKQFADLAAKGEIPGKLVKVVDGIREFRNFGAHASLGELTENEISILDDLTRAVIDYVYTAPSLADSAEQKLKGLKSVSQLKKMIRKNDKAKAAAATATPPAPPAKPGKTPPSKQKPPKPEKK